MKQSVFYILCCLCCYQVTAQTNFNKVWYTGYGILDFKVSPPKDTSINWNLPDDLYANGSSNICDSNGMNLFMTDGCNVYQRDGNYMDNGDTITSSEFAKINDGFSTYPQTSFILPFPDKKYKIIIGCASDSEVINNWNTSTRVAFDELSYSEVDMKENGGWGKVVKKHVVFYTDTTQLGLSKTQMMACKHANGEDWWVLKQAQDTNRVLTFLVTKDSVYFHGSKLYPGPDFGKYDNSGQSMFSQDGTKYATSCRMSDERNWALLNQSNPFRYNGQVFLADFDRCTGKLSNEKVIQVPNQNAQVPSNPNELDHSTQGLCFSPNGRFLYIAMWATIMQYDTQDPDSATAWYRVFGMDTTYGIFWPYSNLGLGPDNRLYVGRINNWLDAMSVIENPDVKGAGCNFCRLCVRFDSTIYPTYVVGPPNMPNYDLGVLEPCWPLGNEELAMPEKEFVVYPNPANNLLTIQCNGMNEKEHEVKIYNLFGELVYKKRFLKDISYQIDVSNLPKGLYVIQVNEMSKKLLIE